MNGASTPRTSVVALTEVRPHHFMHAIGSVLIKLSPDDRARVALAMDCCIAYGARNGMESLAAGVTLGEFDALYAQHVNRLFEAAK